MNHALVVEANETLDLSNVSNISVIQLGDGTLYAQYTGDGATLLIEIEDIISTDI